MTITALFQNICDKIFAGTGVKIVMANVTTVNDDDASLEKSSIIFSVVNIEEDKTLKNQSLYKKVKDDINKAEPREKYKRPAQNLVFSLLFSSYTKNTDQYSDGISKLEQVIRYLQINNFFYFDDTNLYEQAEAPSGEFHKLIIDLVSLKIEQLNQMWSYLGNKYMPSVLYTMRLVPIQDEETTPVPVITIMKRNISLKKIND